MPCPEVVLLRKHILVMSFIGRDQKQAPTLKEAALNKEQMNSAYQQCLQVRRTRERGGKEREREGRERETEGGGRERGGGRVHEIYIMSFPSTINFL